MAQIMYFDIFFTTLRNSLVIGDRPCLVIAVIISCIMVFQRKSNKIILPIICMTTYTSLLTKICFLFYILDPEFNYLSLAKMCWKQTVQYNFVILAVSHHLKPRIPMVRKWCPEQNVIELLKNPKPKNFGKHSPYTDQQFVVFTPEITRFCLPKMMLSIKFQQTLKVFCTHGRRKTKLIPEIFTSKEILLSSSILLVFSNKTPTSLLSQ